jgi:hypothetical protein
LSGTFWDKLDLWLAVAVWALGFLVRGFEWRWLVTAGVISCNLVLVRFSIANHLNPALPMAIYHAGSAIALVAWSASIWGRSIGKCFVAMLALDMAVLNGLISGAIVPGLHFNFWNGISLLQHIQAGLCIALFSTEAYRYGKTNR